MNKYRFGGILFLAGAAYYFYAAIQHFSQGGIASAAAPVIAGAAMTAIAFILLKNSNK